MPPELDEGQASAPAPETAEAPAAGAAESEAATEVAETPEEGAPEAPEAAGEAPETGTEPEPPQPAAKTNQKLVGRIGHLTKTLHQKDEELAAARRRAEAAEALLNRSGEAEGEGAIPPVTTADTPRPGTPEFDRLVDERAAQKARIETFNRDSNAIFDAGVEKHGDAFKEAVTNLNALDMMSPALIEAAMATENPADVINALGSDVDEAARIVSLSPVRMAAEIVKLAGKLSAPTQAAAVSRVPAPINPVGGKTAASLDVYDPELSMEEYARRRKAQGSRFAR